MLRLPLTLVLHPSVTDVGEGTPATLAGAVTVRDTRALVGALVTWGDGEGTPLEAVTAGPGLPLEFGFDHPYADDGSYIAAVGVAYGVLTATNSARFTIHNMAPTVDADTDRVVQVGQALTFGGSFTDHGTVDSHTIVWNFADGESAAGTLMPEHAYHATGTHTVLLQVTDDDGGVGKDTVTVTVAAAQHDIYLPCTMRDF